MILGFFLRWLPAITVFVAVILQELALPWRAWSILRPDLVLVCLLYWRLYRPDRCGPGLAFSAGLMADALATGPLGLNALTKTMIVLFVGDQGSRLRATDFLFLLMVLFFMCAGEQAVQFLLFGLLHGGFPGTDFIVMGRPFATLMLAPVVTLVLVQIHRRFLEEA